VLTAPFANQVLRATAYQPSDRPFPFIVLDHPLQMISPEDIQARARQLVDAIERLLANEMPRNP
jgi:hypothetical protein